MASFFDHSVDVLTDRAGDVSLPVTFNYGGADVEPGFVLHDQTPITVASADGNEILVYGDEGAYFIAASYDPFANLGRGRFALTLGFNANDMDEQEISAQSANADIQFIIRAGDITARLTFAANSEARVEFDRHNDHTHLNIYDYKAFDVTHRATGERYAQSYIPGVTPGQNNQRFKSFPNFLYGYGLSPGVSPDFDDE